MNARKVKVFILGLLGYLGTLGYVMYSNEISEVINWYSSSSSSTMLLVSLGIGAIIGTIIGAVSTFVDVVDELI